MATDFIKEDEKTILLLDETWHDKKGRVLFLTDKRLLFIKDNKINEEINLENIKEAYLDANRIGATRLKISLKNGVVIEETFTLNISNSIISGLFFGDRAELERRTTLNIRWVNAINNQIKR